MKNVYQSQVREYRECHLKRVARTEKGRWLERHLHMDTHAEKITNAYEIRRMRFDKTDWSRTSGT